MTADRPNSIELPKVTATQPDACSQPRRSKVGKWRALVLGLIYVGFIAHFAHWWFAGKTLSPIEPSEAMYTLEQGLLNAGFICLLLGIVSTLILGRWFCGWGCHIIALQDLCTWLLKKLHFRPKPFRSRLLMFVPLAAALYMFVWPSALRLFEDRPAPAVVYHLFTYDFWQTFPGPLMSIITLIVAGFLIVVLLGNKGYCYYACPYGGFFGLADKLAVGRIRVTDACSQCGHCTATCTSNVRVHEEVKRFGMVVDPGCMKCTDCISVCPKDALYFGFGRPSLAKSAPRAAAQPRGYDYTWPEEIALASFFVVSLYAFRGLYDAIPLLLALGMASIAAYLLVQLGRMFYEENLRVHAISLKLKGRITAGGWAFGLFGLLLAAWVAHSAILQYHLIEGDRLLAHASQHQAASAMGIDTETIEASRDALEHLLWVRRFALVPLASVETQLGSLYLFLGELNNAEPHLRQALKLMPSYGAARYKWAEVIARRGDVAGGLIELRRALDDDPGLADARQDLVRALVQSGQRNEAIAIVSRIVARRPHDAAARLDLSALLVDAGDAERGVAEAREATRLQPEWADAHFREAVAETAKGNLDAAVEACNRASQLNPRDPRPLLAIAHVRTVARQYEDAEAALSAARRLAPRAPEVLIMWAAGMRAIGKVDDAIAAAEAANSDDLDARYGLVYLQLAVGDARAARSTYEAISALDPNLPRPPIP